jgi:hypothetical protein
MRFPSPLAAVSLLLLSACIPASEPPPRRAVPGSGEWSTRQCFADLQAAAVGFERLPDRRFDGGCAIVDTVQLLDIGLPVTNLKAMTCPLARSLTAWAREDVQAAASSWLGTRVTRIESFGTYGCRSVNNRPGARLSEHGRANAVDIAAFVLADGRRITVLDGWNSGDGRVRGFLRQVHRQGCRRFNIGLGPDADEWHRNHFHFDMGAGPYCR